MGISEDGFPGGLCGSLLRGGAAVLFCVFCPRLADALPAPWSSPFLSSSAPWKLNTGRGPQLGPGAVVSSVHLLITPSSPNPWVSAGTTEDVCPPGIYPHGNHRRVLNELECHGSGKGEEGVAGPGVEADTEDAQNTGEEGWREQNKECSPVHRVSWVLVLMNRGKQGVWEAENIEEVHPGRGRQTIHNPGNPSVIVTMTWANWGNCWR